MLVCYMESNTHLTIELSTIVRCGLFNLYSSMSTGRESGSCMRYGGREGSLGSKKSKKEETLCSLN